MGAENGGVQLRGVSSKNTYQPEDDKNSTHWCEKCRVWYHEGCCGDPLTKPLNKMASDFGQAYLSAEQWELSQVQPDFDFVGLITTPIQRLNSEPHRAPFSLEKLQIRCREFYLKDQVPESLSLSELAQDVQFFRLWDEKVDAHKVVEQILLHLIDLGRWYLCPGCQKQYI
jgi:hypothetical protein